MKFNIFGLKKHYYPNNNIVYTICLYNNNGNYEISSRNNLIHVTKVISFGGITHRAHQNNSFIEINGTIQNFRCSYFRIVDGNITINNKKFIKTLRGFDKAPIWVFINSDAIISEIFDLDIFYLDNYENLDDIPQKIYADIIVLGNKFNLDQIYERINDYEIIIVKFDYGFINDSNHHKTWIFHGASGIGKSFLGLKIKNLSVFETDVINIYPILMINSDVVILGNRHKWNFDHFKDMINGSVVSVKFSKFMMR